MGLLVLGISFIAAGLLIGSFQNRKAEERAKEILNSNTSKPTSIVGQKQNTIQVLVKKVLDGDTIETDKGEVIRYLGINAPEVGQPFFKESLEANKDLVLNKNARLELDIEKKDRYGRTLIYMFIGNAFINEELVKKGLAVSQTIQPNVKYQNLFVKAQEGARSNCLGIWESLCKTEKTSCVKIASINADASGNDNLNKNGEWIEFRNTCNKQIDMDGWILKDSSSSNQYQFVRLLIDSGKGVVLYSGCGSNTSEKLYWQCPQQKYAIWNNAGDSAFLYNEKGELVETYSY